MVWPGETGARSDRFAAREHAFELAREGARELAAIRRDAACAARERQAEERYARRRAWAAETPSGFGRP